MYNHNRNSAPKSLSLPVASSRSPPAHHPGALPLIFFFTFLPLQVVCLCLVLFNWFLWYLCASVLLPHVYNYRKCFCSLFPYWKNCFVFILKVEGWHLQWDVVFGVRGTFLGRLGWFLAAKKRGERSLGGGLCLDGDTGGSWLLGFGVKQLVKMWDPVNKFIF